MVTSAWRSPCILRSEVDKELIWQMIYTFVPILSAVGNFAIVGGIAYLSLLAFTPVFWVPPELPACSTLPRAQLRESHPTDTRFATNCSADSALL